MIQVPFKLMQHQAEAVRFLSERRCAWIQYEMGLGKTVIFLEHLKAKRDAGMLPTLIICPKNVVPVWQDEAKKWGYDFSFVELTGTTLNRVKLLQNTNADIYVINYDALRLVKTQLLNKGFKTIILDESHRIKERSAQQSAVAHALGEAATFRYASTGTPITKSPEDLWSQAFFLHKDLLPNWYSFCAKYVNYRTITIPVSRMSKDGKTFIKDRRDVKKALGLRSSTKTELTSRLSEVVLRKTKTECLDLPDKIYKRIEVDLTKDQLALYKQVIASMKSLKANGEFNEESARLSVHKMQQICQGFVYNPDKSVVYAKSSCKVEALKDLLEDLHGKKIILFTWYKADIDNIVESLNGDHEILVYDGTDEHRKNVIKRFQEEDKPFIFLSNIERAKEGITLTAASDVIYFGNSYNYGSRKQSEDRAHRTGQKNNVTYYDIIAKNTVDERVTKALLDKKEMADTITGDNMRLALLEFERKI